MLRVYGLVFMMSFFLILTVRYPSGNAVFGYGVVVLATIVPLVSLTIISLTTRTNLSALNKSFCRK